MLSVVHYYVFIKYYSPINGEEELKNLIFKMKNIKENAELIYSIEVDKPYKHVYLELSEEGYNYIKNTTFEFLDVKLQSVTMYLNSYKFHRNRND